MAMASSTLLGLLSEACEIFLKNGKLMAFIIFLNLLINSLLYLFNFYPTKPLINDLIIKLLTLIRTSPSSPEFAKLVVDLENPLGVFIEVEVIYFLVNLIVFVFLSSLTIFASAAILAGYDLTFKDLVLKAASSYKRSLLTWLCTYLYGLGYLFLLLALLLPLGLIMDHPDAASIASIAILVLLDLVLYLYIYVTLTLALVVSVLEQVCGFEAIRKAARISMGRQKQGFILNLSFYILSCLLVQGVRLIQFQQSMAIQIIVGLLVTGSVSLVNMFWLTAYTAFYNQCKKNHGEVVEFPGSSGYAKIRNPPLIDDSIP